MTTPTPTEAIAALVEAAKAFRSKAEFIALSTAFRKVFDCARVHGVPYEGENWESEHAALLDALAACEGLPPLAGMVLVPREDVEEAADHCDDAATMDDMAYHDAESGMKSRACAARLRACLPGAKP